MNMNGVSNTLSGYQNISSTGGALFGENPAISSDPEAKILMFPKPLPGLPGQHDTSQESIKLIKMMMQLASMLIEMVRQLLPQTGRLSSQEPADTALDFSTNGVASPITTITGGEWESSMIGDPASAGGSPSGTQSCSTASNATTSNQLDQDNFRSISNPPTQSGESSLGVFESIGQFLTSLGQTILGKEGSTPNWLQEIKGVVDSGLEKFSGLKDGLFKVIETVVNISSLFYGGKLFKDIFKGIANFGEFIAKGSKFVKSGFNKAKDFVKKLF